MLRRIGLSLVAVFLSLITTTGAVDGLGVGSPSTNPFNSTALSYPYDTSITVNWTVADPGSLISVVLVNASSLESQPICSDIATPNCVHYEDGHSGYFKFTAFRSPRLPSMDPTHFYFQIAWGLPGLPLSLKNSTQFTFSDPPSSTLSVGSPSSSGSGGVGIAVGSGTGNVLITATATTSPTMAATETIASSPTSTAVSETSEGLSTAAKAGIGAGIGVAALAAIVALFYFFFRRRKNRSEATANGMAYAHTHDADSRDLRVEKEMNVVTTGGVYSPVDRGEGFHEIPHAVESHDSYNHEQLPTDHQQNWQEDDGHVYEDVAQVPTSAPASPPHVGSTVAHLQEPGMTAEEIAKLDDEERRIDEAIAEAERRRRNLDE